MFAHVHAQQQYVMYDWNVEACRGRVVEYDDDDDDDDAAVYCDWCSALRAPVNCRQIHDYTVQNIRTSTDILWRVFRILSEPVPCTIVSVNRRNNEARAHITRHKIFEDIRIFLQCMPGCVFNSCRPVHCKIRCHVCNSCPPCMRYTAVPTEYTTSTVPIPVFLALSVTVTGRLLVKPCSDKLSKRRPLLLKKTPFVDQHCLRWSFKCDISLFPTVVQAALDKISTDFERRAVPRQRC